MERKRTPKVVNPSRFIYAKNNPDGKFANKEKNQKLVAEMSDYYSKEQQVLNMVDYYNGDLKTKKGISHGYTSFLMEDGHNASKEEIKKRKNEYLKAWENSNVYQTVISFDNNFIDENISLKNLEKLMMTEMLPQYLKKIGFQDMNKMLYNASLHLDSKSGHYHFHIAFAEKEANYRSPSAKGKAPLKYRRRGEVSLEDFNFFKRVITNSIERDGSLKKYRIELNQDIANIKERFNIKSENYVLRDIKDLQLKEKIDKLSSLLVEEKKNKSSSSKLKFGSIKNKEIVLLTKDISNSLYNDMLKEEKKEFDETLDKINKYYQKLNEDNNIREEIKESQESINKREYVDNYVYNAIINNVLEGRDHISREDLIKEMVNKRNIVLKKNNPEDYYLPSSKSYRKDNIIDMLSKKPTKAELRRSATALKQEMEDAIKEFSKTFQADSYSHYY